MPKITFAQAINQALREEMRADQSVFLMGEDIGVFGGIFKVTSGLLSEFGEERVRDAPLSEAAIVGAGVGAALTGMRPVVEVMFTDFLTLAMDQIVNQAAKVFYMFGEQSPVPLVIRVATGLGRSAGAHHTQSLEAWFAHVPGLKVVLPSTPYDAKGLLKASIRDNNPVLFMEHVMLYPMMGEVSEEDYIIPIGTAEVKRSGQDLTLISWSYMVHRCLEAANLLSQEGIDAEVIDVRSLRPLDTDTIVASVKKTGRVVIVHQACKTMGAGSEIAAVICESAFDYLDAPIRRVAGYDSPIPFAPHLESAVIPAVKDIVEAAKEVLGVGSKD